MRQTFLKKWSSLLLVAIMLVMTVTPIGSFADEATSETIEIFTFNDFHGALSEDVREGRSAGMAKMITAARQLREEHPNILFLSGGDNYQGSVTSNLLYGAPVSQMMKEMGVLASSVGNHEFDWGHEWIAKWAEEGDLTFLASNIYDDATGEPVEWAKPYMITEVAGVKIGLIGLAHEDTATLTKAEYVKGFSFKDAVESAQIWVDFLRAGKAEEGTPDVIIALTHIDSAQNRDTKAITGGVVRLAEEVEGLDAIISGHSHQEVAGYVNGVAIVQAHSAGRMLGRLTLKLENGKVTEVVPSMDYLGVRKIDITADEDAVALFEAAEAETLPIKSVVIGEAEGTFAHGREIPNVSPLGRWVTEVMRKRTGVQVAIQNGGGLRTVIEEGTITMGDLYAVMPFDNQLVTMELPGADLWKAIDHGILNPDIGDGQFSGLVVVYDESKEFHHRVVSITLEDGTPLDLEAYYTVVVNDFMATGGDKYNFSNARNVVDTFIPVRDVLVDYIKEVGTITARPVDYLFEVSEVATEEPKAEEPKVEEPKVEEPVKKEPVVYVVKSGDVLWRIAKNYNMTYQEIATFNNLKNPNLILVGQKLLIPVK